MIHVSGRITGYDDGTVPAPRLERVLAVGRALLTVSALVAIYLDPREPARLAGLTYGVLLGYAVYSLLVMGLVHASPRIGATHGIVLHLLDILWTSALTFVSEGPVSPFFLFFLFVLLSAAYRWSFRETVATAAGTVFIFLVETTVVVAGPWHPEWLGAIDFDLNGTILRVTYLLLTGFLLGYLAQQEKRFREDTAAIALAGYQPRVDLGLSGSIAAVAETLSRIFDAAAVAIVLRDNETGRARAWVLDSATSSATMARAQELSPDSEAAWLFGPPGSVWEVQVSAGTSDLTPARVVEPNVWPVRRASVELPGVVRQMAMRSVTAADMELPGEWRGRVYLFDVTTPRSLERRVHLLEAIATRVTPALTNVFLMQRLRSEASATERARVARELHDGAIQALIGIQMTVEAMRRRPQDASAVERDLTAIQELLGREVGSLRELMQALRPVRTDASEALGDALAGLVERFRRDSGVSARFVGSGGPVRLHPATSLEVMRIAQEALMNVRKHSGARNVVVRLTRTGDRCELSVEDDGCGFAFEGALTRAELDDRRVGPTIIKERARAIGADLVVQSHRGSGARLQVTVREDALV